MEIYVKAWKLYTGEFLPDMMGEDWAAVENIACRDMYFDCVEELCHYLKTEEKFEALCTFLREARIERAGVFAFSPQEGTPAAELPDQVDDEEKERRVSLITMLQGEIMDAYNESLVGQTLDILCEGYDRLSEVWFGRSFADSPDVDGKVFFTAKKGEAAEGRFCRVQIDELLDGEPLGHIVSEA